MVRPNPVHHFFLGQQFGQRVVQGLPRSSAFKTVACAKCKAKSKAQAMARPAGAPCRPLPSTVTVVTARPPASQQAAARTHILELSHNRVPGGGASSLRPAGEAKHTCSLFAERRSLVLALTLPLPNFCLQCYRGGGGLCSQSLLFFLHCRLC